MTTADPTPQPEDEGRPITIKFLAALYSGRPELEHDESLTDEDAERIASEATAANRLKVEARRAQATAALAEANRLIEERGKDDPLAILAMVKAIDLDDPTYFERELKAQGREAPKAAYFTEDGRPMYLTADVAACAGVTEEEAERAIKQMVEVGMATRPDGPLYRVQ